MAANLARNTSSRFAPDARRSCPRARSTDSRSSLLVEHDLFGKPASTFPDHALVGCTQPIANAGLGQDVFGLFGIGLDLLPQLTHVHAEILGVGQTVPQFT